MFTTGVYHLATEKPAYGVYIIRAVEVSTTGVCHPVTDKPLCGVCVYIIRALVFDLFVY